MTEKHTSPNMQVLAHVDANVGHGVVNYQCQDCDFDARPNDPGWAGRDANNRQQCLTCWKWTYPVIHSCPGVPQAGRTAPKCCDQHHYSCALAEDGPPLYCCPRCPYRKAS